VNTLELEYNGDDLIISKEMVEQEFGLLPGDRLEIRPKLVLVPLKRTPEDLKAIEEACQDLRQAFEPADLEDWEDARKALWDQWQSQL